jgi:uncharacterized protein (TIGR03084 family)
MTISEITADLEAEQAALDDIVSNITRTEWRLATPSAGWTIAHQIAHLAYYDQAAAVAMTAQERFFEMVNQLVAAIADGGLPAGDSFALDGYLAMEPRDLITEWRSARTRLATAAAELSEDLRVPWYGPAMRARSFLTARLMETWAHGQDVVDALGIDRPGTSRLRHIVHLGFRTRGWSYANRGLAAPGEPVSVALTSPAGDIWQHGPADATETVTGPARDFCLVVTQRRHLDDTTLTATDKAREWLLIAQAFAGPATDGPAPSNPRPGG